MLHISKDEYRERLAKLETAIARAGLDLFLVSSFDSIHYLTGAGFEPLERPFFLLVYPLNARAPLLLVPKLDEEHMRKARNIDEVHSYWDYPAPEGRCWPDRLRSLIGSGRRAGVEPSLRLEILHELQGFTTEMHPLVEQLRLIKTPTEVEMIRRGATAVCIGRPFVWGLGAFGQAGVERVLELLRAELVVTMKLAGTTAISDLTPNFIRRRQR